MDELGWHLTFRARDSRVLAPDVRAQRALATACHRIGARFGILSFRASDDHLHTTVRCPRAEAGAFAQAVGSALTHTLGIAVGFSPAYFERIRDQAHLDRSFAYDLRNQEKHEVDLDPLHDASSIQELLGLRLGADGYLQRVRASVRRVSREMLLGLLGVPSLEPCVRLEWLADAAAGAVGLAVLDGSDRAVRARGAAARVAVGSFRTSAVAEALGVTDRAVRRLAARDSDELLERAIQLRMGLRQALGPRALATRPIRSATLRPSPEA